MSTETRDEREYTVTVTGRLPGMPDHTQTVSGRGPWVGAALRALADEIDPPRPVLRKPPADMGWLKTPPATRSVTTPPTPSTRVENVEGEPTKRGEQIGSSRFVDVELPPEGSEDHAVVMDVYHRINADAPRSMLLMGLKSVWAVLQAVREVRPDFADADDVDFHDEAFRDAVAVRAGLTYGHMRLRMVALVAKAYREHLNDSSPTPGPQARDEMKKRGAFEVAREALLTRYGTTDPARLRILGAEEHEIGAAKNVSARFGVEPQIPARDGTQ